MAEMNAKEWLTKQLSETDDATTEVQGTDGSVVHVKNMIPFEQLREAAITLAALLIVEDDENEAFYKMFAQTLAANYVFCKYYTDIPTDGLDGEDDFALLFDFVRKVGYNLNEHWLYGHKDFSLVEEMADAVIESRKVIFEKAHSPLKRLGQIVNSVPADSDEWANELARSREVNDQMIDLLGYRNEAMEKERAVQENENKANALLSFAKVNK